MAFSTEFSPTGWTQAVLILTLKKSTNTYHCHPPPIYVSQWISGKHPKWTWSMLSERQGRKRCHTLRFSVKNACDIKLHISSVKCEALLRSSPGLGSEWSCSSLTTRPRKRDMHVSALLGDLELSLRGWGGWAQGGTRKASLCLYCMCLGDNRGLSLDLIQ